MELKSILENYEPVNQDLKDLKTSLNILENFVKRYPVLNNETNFYLKLIQASILKLNDFFIIHPVSWRYYSTTKNQIILYNPNGRKFNDYKTFNPLTVRPNTILSKKGQLTYAHLGNDCYYDIKDNNLFINFNSFVPLRENPSYKEVIGFGLYLFKESLPEDLLESFVKTIETVNNTANFNSEMIELRAEALELVRQDMLNTIPNTIERITKDNLNSIISRSKSKISNYKNEIRALSDTIVLAEASLNNATDKLKEVNNYIKYLFKENQIRTIRSDGSSLIKITTQPMQVAYYDTEQLEKIITQNQLGLDQDRLDALTKVFNYEAKLMILPIDISMDISIGGTNINSSYGLNFSTNSNLCPSYELTNAHAAYTSTGCVGSFRAPMEIAKAEGNIQGLLALTMQYLKSMTIHDPMGNKMLKRCIIVDNNNKIISYPGVSPVFKGVNIFDFVDNALFRLPIDSIVKFKEEHYGNQNNE